MNPAHAKLREMGLNDDDFNTVKSTLLATLEEEFSFTQDQLLQVSAIVESTRDQARSGFSLIPLGGDSSQFVCSHEQLCIT